MKRVKGGFVSNHLLDKVKVGDSFESTGPSGTFYYEPLADSPDLVFLAGGSGVTPFASIIREVVEKNSPLTIHLIYGNKDPEDIIFGKELAEIAYLHDNIKVDFVIDQPLEEWRGLCGLLDADMIISLTGTVEGKTFFICGPAAMYPFCSGALKALGVPERSIKMEAYGPPPDATEEPGWPGVLKDAIFLVLEERSGKTIEARAGEPLMVSLERSGIVVPAVCRSG